MKSNINTMFWSSSIIPFSLIKRWLRSYSVTFWPNPGVLLLFTSLNSTRTKKNKKTKVDTQPLKYTPYFLNKISFVLLLV